MGSAMNFEVVAEGLQFPEGPIAMVDGSVLVVEIRRQTLTRVWPDGTQEIVAELGGGPNGAAIGPDGAAGTEAELQQWLRLNERRGTRVSE
jgi:gluconolactonase